ncbi:MAG: 30S ribosomal protein S6 [Candidatus Berkelbacteria bacterium]|nr:30S ribosomal protein S6 [Candidatus Berkelbacteria bacterium]
MREYELTYLVSDDVLEKDLKAVSDKVAGIISASDGTISKEEPWGRRKLAYPIKKQNFASYFTLWITMPAEKVVAIDHELRVYPQVIRHLIVSKVQKNKELTVTTSDVVDTADVKDILGEKSFEVVEGETEESKDLMATREIKSEDSKSQETNSKQILNSKSEIPNKEEIKTEPVKAKVIKPKKESKEDEADRMKKLDEKLDELLGDDL